MSKITIPVTVRKHILNSNVVAYGWRGCYCCDFEGNSHSKYCDNTGNVENNKRIVQLVENDGSIGEYTLCQIDVFKPMKQGKPRDYFLYNFYFMNQDTDALPEMIYPPLFDVVVNGKRLSGKNLEAKRFHQGGYYNNPFTMMNWCYIKSTEEVLGFIGNNNKEIELEFLPVEESV